MRSTLVILATLALLFISCSDEFPPAPKYQFCKLVDAKGDTIYPSIHEFSKEDCDAVDGDIVDSIPQSLR